MAHAPVKPRYYFLEANMSGDKKASHQSFLNVRGRKVTAEVLLPSALVEDRAARHARSSFADYWRMARDGRRAVAAPSACRATSPTGWRRSTSPAARTRRAWRNRPWAPPASSCDGERPLRHRDAAERDGRHGRRRHELPSQHACLEWLGLAGRGARQRAGRSRGRTGAGGRAVDHRRAHRRTVRPARTPRWHAAAPAERQSRRADRPHDDAPLVGLSARALPRGRPWRR